jgi:hypothetical protein
MGFLIDRSRWKGQPSPCHPVYGAQERVSLRLKGLGLESKEGIDMEKIVIFVNKQEERYLLLELIREFFPECEVQTVTIDGDSSREVSNPLPARGGHE